MKDILDVFVARGDLAHVALFLWAAAATFGALTGLRALVDANRRFDEFVRELSQFNRRFSGDSEP